MCEQDKCPDYADGHTGNSQVPKWDGTWRLDWRWQNGWAAVSTLMTWAGHSLDVGVGRAA